MIIFKSDGSKWWLDDDANEHPYRWYHGVRDSVLHWWYSRPWRRRQKEFIKTGTRYYGDGGTIHFTTHVDVEIAPTGQVVAVWFRCQHLPFKMRKIDERRAAEMREMYTDFKSELHGVEIKDASRIRD
jgi:hypothetical protein